MRISKTKSENALVIRNFVFGVEDSLVSTVGLLSGVAAAGVSKQTIFLTGLVLIFVEAFSMGIGSFLSEESVEEYENIKSTKNGKTYFAASIMFISYFLSGFIPLFPYLIFTTTTAFIISVALSLLALFILGAISATVYHRNIFKKGIEMLLLGGLAIMAGIVVGFVAKDY